MFLYMDTIRHWKPFRVVLSEGAYFLIFSYLRGKTFMCMELTDDLFLFIKEHASDDLNRLLLSASRYPGIDIPFVTDQIRARRQIRDKLPSWFRNDRLVFPSKIAAEQCSSELTASYKQGLVHADMHLCDLTGGLGIDSFFYSRTVRRVTYIERFPVYCEAARHNFGALGADNITVLNGDSSVFIQRLEDVDVFYLDPARRGDGNKRVFALRDCEPDVPGLLPLLFRYAPKVIAKLSPMADLQLTLDLLPCTTEIHILSVRNECKELLFVMERDGGSGNPLIYCVNYGTDHQPDLFTYALLEEREVNSHQADGVRAYLYEPNASILKAGAFKMVAYRLGLEKLHRNSHLYTSGEKKEGFPGRSFAVEEVIPFNNKECKSLSVRIPRANITVRNFPLSVEELRKRTRIADGGDVYLFATTLANGERVLIKARK